MLLKLTFLTLTLATTSAQNSTSDTSPAPGECSANQYVPGIGCDPSPNICEVTCPVEENCVLSEGCTDALVPDNITHAEMDQTKCQELCEASDLVDDATRCRFWRYVSFLHVAKSL